MPTTIGDMTWGVAFFQRDRMFSYHDAVVTGSLSSTGMGDWLSAARLARGSDRPPQACAHRRCGRHAVVGRRHCFQYRPHAPRQIGCLIFGIASGAAMIPYTIVKEVNPDEVKGSATGAINFLTFGVTALIGPIFADSLGKGIASTHNHVAHFRASGVFWIVGIAIAILLSVFLRETGHAHKKA